MTEADETRTDLAAQGNAPDATTSTDLAATARSTRMGTKWVTAVVALLLVVVVVFAVVLWNKNRTLQNSANRTEAVATTAGGLGKALLSYNSADLAASRNRVLALATASFTKTYNQDFTKSLGGTITALKATSTATVRDVYVANVINATAKAIVVVDFQTKSKAGTRKVLGTNLQMDLVRQSGHWKVNSVTVISATSESQSPPSG